MFYFQGPERGPNGHGHSRLASGSWNFECLFSFLSYVRAFSKISPDGMCVLQSLKKVFLNQERPGGSFREVFPHLRPIRRDDQRGPWPPLKLFDVGIWADCLAKPLSGAGLAAALSENLLFLLSILPENYCQERYLQECFSEGVFFFFFLLTINFPLASPVPLTLGNLFFYGPPRRPGAQGVCSPPLFPLQTLL